MSHPMKQLLEFGQSFWWDQLSRGELDDGTVARMRDHNGMRGMTSNPAIFKKSIAASEDYDAAILELAAQGLGSEEIFWRLAVEDIQRACDVLRSVFDESDGVDGYVSLEVDPRLSADSEATLAEARRLWGQVDRPNLMIKIPGTDEGLPAIRAALVEGLNVNVTLLFSAQAHLQVMEAYLSALEERARRGLPLSTVASVASFFVSRVDGLIDEELAAADSTIEAGKAGVANARLAYANFEKVFSGERWAKLAAEGARVQRPLWASTSVKNPDYPDTMYVSELIGEHTVNTMPTVTLEAWIDHGVGRAGSVREDLDAARDHLSALREAGIDIDRVTDELLRAGVAQFEQAFSALLAAVDEKAQRLGSTPR